MSDIESERYLGGGLNDLELPAVIQELRGLRQRVEQDERETAEIRRRADEDRKRNSDRIAALTAVVEKHSRDLQGVAEMEMEMSHAQNTTNFMLYRFLLDEIRSLVAREKGYSYWHDIPDRLKRRHALDILSTRMSMESTAFPCTPEHLSDILLDNRFIYHESANHLAEAISDAADETHRAAFDCFHRVWSHTLPQ